MHPGNARGLSISPPARPYACATQPMATPFS